MIYNKFVSIVRQLSIQPDYILPQKRLLYSKCKANLTIIINNSTCKRLLRYAKRGDGYRKATINTKAATCTQCLLQKKRQSVVCRRLNCYVACFCHLSRPPPMQGKRHLWQVDLFAKAHELMKNKTKSAMPSKRLSFTMNVKQ